MPEPSQNGIRETAKRAIPRTRDEARTAFGNQLRPVFWTGVLIAGVFFAGLGGWAATAPLASAAIAPGVLSVDTNRKTIQHLEGGIVAEIAVRDGDRVSAGQLLIRLDETQPKVVLDQLKTRFNAASALEARLVAERDELETISFPEWLLVEKERGDAEEALAGEISIFEARRLALQRRESILRQRIAQYEEEIQGLKGQIASESHQLELAGKEIASLEKLVSQKLAGQSRMLELMRERAEIEGSRNRNRAMIARARQNIAEEKLRILELGTVRRNEVVAQLREVQTELFDLEERIRAAEDVLRRTKVVAPIHGTIVGLKVHTVGGVIGPGRPLMDIVPQNEKLVIQARVDPKDIDTVNPGLVAQIRLTAFSQRHVAPIQGQVVSVSADRLTDERSGEPYFLARIELPPDAMKSASGFELYPGMQAEVMILTGERTALDYILRPLTRTFERSLRED